MNRREFLKIIPKTIIAFPIVGLSRITSNNPTELVRFNGKSDYLGRTDWSDPDLYKLPLLADFWPMPD